MITIFSKKHTEKINKRPPTPSHDHNHTHTPQRERERERVIDGNLELTCKPGKTALLMADSSSMPKTGSFLKNIMPPLGPLRDCRKRCQIAYDDA